MDADKSILIVFDFKVGMDPSKTYKVVHDVRSQRVVCSDGRTWNVLHDDTSLAFSFKEERQSLSK